MSGRKDLSEPATQCRWQNWVMGDILRYDCSGVGGRVGSTDAGKYLCLEDMKGSDIKSMN